MGWCTISGIMLCLSWLNLVDSHCYSVEVWDASNGCGVHAFAWSQLVCGQSGELLLVEGGPWGVGRPDQKKNADLWLAFNGFSLGYWSWKYIVTFLTEEEGISLTILTVTMWLGSKIAPGLESRFLSLDHINIRHLFSHMLFCCQGAIVPWSVCSAPPHQDTDLLLVSQEQMREPSL